MNINEYLELVAYKKPYKGEHGFPDGVQYFSKFDDSYITLEGMEEDVSFMAENEITEQLSHGLGFSPKHNKWFGWSHRAVYGFTIGSKCEKGSCHYVADTPEGLIEDHAQFYSDFGDEEVQLKRDECQILDDRSGIRILPKPLIIPVAKNMDDIVNALDNPDETKDFEDFDISGDFHIVKCGRGEWTAKTMEDAKQMAMDFREGVS